MYRVFSLTWSASMQIYWNIKESIYIIIWKEFTSHWIGLEHQHGRRFIRFWKPNMAIVTSCDALSHHPLLTDLNTACSINMIASFQNKEYRLVYYYWKHKSDITQNIITWKKVLKQAIPQKRATYTPLHSSQHLKISVKTRIVLFCYSRTR